eukprot:5256312-Prymnesium_polylepis.1
MRARVAHRRYIAAQPPGATPSPGQASATTDERSNGAAQCAPCWSRGLCGKGGQRVCVCVNGLRGRGTR